MRGRGDPENRGSSNWANTVTGRWSGVRRAARRTTLGQWGETDELGISAAAVLEDDPAVRRAGIAADLIDAGDGRGAVRATIQSQSANGEC